MFEKDLLAGKRILVTGGGSGLGAAMGRRFVELGAELIICGRRLELLEAAAAQMRGELGGKVAVSRCDIRDGAAVDAPEDVETIRIGGENGLVDARGLANARYDAEPGTAYLLRPDGYVAARVRHPSRPALDAALKRAAGLDRGLS